MEWTDLVRRAAGVDRYIGQGSPGAHAGRWLCINCPRDWHMPPFLPFRLPIHIREHREKFPDHAIAWWCWDHVMVEEVHTTGWRWAKEPFSTRPASIHQNGGSPMTQLFPVENAILGACVRCNQVWVVTAERSHCLGCGNPPTHVTNLPSAGGASAPQDLPTSTAEEPSLDFLILPLICPRCDTLLEVTVGDEGLIARPVPPPTPAEEEVAPAAPPATDVSLPEPAAGEGEPATVNAPSPAPPSAPTDESPEEPQEEPANV